ncbi:MAG: CHAD domain-containing protein [Solirubrobacteraceae bacterium]
MSEREFMLPGPAAMARVASELNLIGDDKYECERTFYDTFDGRLRSSAKLMFHERGRLWLGSLSAACAAAPDRVLAHELAPGRLRDALAKAAGIRAALPLVRVQTRVQEHRVLDDEDKTVGRIIVEAPSLIKPGGRAVELRVRTRCLPVRGYGAELDRVEAVLGESFEPAGQTVLDEAVLAAGGKPGGISSKIEVPLSFAQRGDAAAAAVLRALAEVIEINLEGTIADTDAEFLHDFRVALRRSRAVQRELKMVFPPRELAPWRGELRWLQQVTGDARDLDAHVLEFEAMRGLVPEPLQVDLDPLSAVLGRRRLQARREMVKALRSERAIRLRREWDALLEDLVAKAITERPRATSPIGELVGERIRKVYRRMVKMGHAIDVAAPPDAYHELRKQGKELRYLLELFGAPLFPGEVVKPMIKTLKALQDVLGRHQDREVQVATLVVLRDEVSGVPGGPAALMAMGVLVDRLMADELAAREEFAEHFRAFAGKAQRQRVEQTFR